MTADFQQLIISRLDAISEKQSEHGEAIAGVQASLRSIIGNGQPGRLGVLECDVKELRDWKSHSKGWFAGVGAILTALGAIGHALVDWVRHKP